MFFETFHSGIGNLENVEQPVMVQVNGTESNVYKLAVLDG